MKDDDELEMLLGEIPHATSSLNLQYILNNGHHHHSHHHHHNNLVDHGYGHASCVTQSVNGHGHGHGHGQVQGNVHGMCGDEYLKHKYACTSSPVSGFSLQSDGSSSSLFSSGGRSFSDIGSPTPPQFEDFKSHLISGNGFCLDFKKANESNLVDAFNLSRNFSKMYIGDEQEGFPVAPYGIQCRDQSLNGARGMSFDKYRASDNYRKDLSDWGGIHLSVPIRPMNFEGQVGLLGSCYSPSQSDRLFSRSDFGNSALSPQFYRCNVSANNNFPMGFSVSNVSSSIDNLSAVGGSLYHPSRNGMNLTESEHAVYSPNMVRLAQLMPHYNEENLLHYQPSVPNGRDKVPLCAGVPQVSVEPFTREDSLFLQGKGFNYSMTRHARPRGQNTRSFHNGSGSGKTQEKGSQIDGGHRHNAAVQDCSQSPKMYCPHVLSTTCSSLAEARGHIYHIAKDQHGCRFLQRMFDEGTSLDVQIIFNEIIDHAAELMMNPFGNYLMQKLLEVCNEEQRMFILLRVTEEPGELVRISLNTHGTRVVQKLVETLKTTQQISLVISALEPGFLCPHQDLNGNHVIQRCLQCFTSEDSKVISKSLLSIRVHFVAAAKYCVDIATHQHGCCVLQRCISRSTGEHRENLVAEISANGLLLAQDAFGNYVVQFVLGLKIPCAMSKLTSQFEGNYVHLSTQKFSSHVVEKCLVVCNEEARSKIIHELLSATYFDRLLQDPHANYVVQTALRVSEGRLHNSLVAAIESYKAISRNSPYSKRIFSHKLLKR
ncbi:UNVERIFIED_CONTAM: putative pumilio7, chloroplastic [Sesamum radiatum]|uniref:Pumilio7, chloroplastic n=1 Tax=Sesamum radiatum TaxID=300843 RepID=A0AAW2S3L4_SESRA